MTAPTPAEILALPLNPDNEAESATVGEYLQKLLLTLWRETSEFSGKRPWGNSGWENDLYYPLIKAGYIDGHIDDEGYLEECDEVGGDILITTAIQAVKFT